ncbi:patatin-like phospholipase family protein [Oxalobacteraceae bacterium]|nr:patatin-like phospholipase family protein [Oxalobacteraceae bacterium]
MSDQEDAMPGASAPVECTWMDWLRRNKLDSLIDPGSEQNTIFAKLAWEPNAGDRLAAWSLYTEMRTRITSQPLEFRSGDESSALSSVYSLFEISRNLINAHPQCTHFAALTVHVLNVKVRPFTAYWHKLSLSGALSAADVRFQFRHQLRELQRVLRVFSVLLGLLAEDLPALADALRSEPAAPPDTDAAHWTSLPFGIKASPADPTFSALNQAEQNEVQARRQRYHPDTAADSAGRNAVGLAVSGGGIRSATFALGVVQTLARKGILRDVDFLSTVSGGGYLGGFISAFLDDADDRVTLAPAASALPFGDGREPESRAARHLRNHSKYLSEGGLGTVARLAWQLMFGIFISVLLTSPFLAAAVALAFQFKDRFTPTATQLFERDLGTTVLLAVFAVAAIVLPITQSYCHNGRFKHNAERICIALALLVLGLLLSRALPPAFAALAPHAHDILLATLLFPFVAGGIALACKPGAKTRRLSLASLVLTGPLVAFGAFLWLCTIFVLPPQAQITPVYEFGLAALLYTSFFININFTSLHGFYRQRLARTYLTRASATPAGVTPREQVLLSEMHANHKSPYHLVSAALNIPSCKNPDLLGRRTDFFMFSKHYCGSPITGIHPTTDWEAADPHLDLATAIAISGAAAAPNMGTLSSTNFRFLLAIFNIRLGYWARRPSPARDSWFGRVLKRLPPVGWYYFLRELAGNFNEHGAYLNLSDGGHIENLGIYELLRRRCKFIIAIDGEADPELSFGGLIRLTQLAKVDLGVDIEPDLSDLRLNAGGHGHAHFGLSRIDYADSGEHGFLLYIKSSLSGNESEFLNLYRAQNPDFPHQSTAQQLFGEIQFEAYRSLGQHIGEDLFRSDLVDDWQRALGATIWFRRLARHLL